MRRSRFLLATATVAAGGLAAALPATAAPTKSAASPVAVDAGAVTTRVTVRMGEFFFRLSKPRAPRGTVIFTVINVGQIPHDFDFITGIRKSMPVIQPGKRFTYRLTFRKKGRYGYVCTLPRHAQDGMSGQFVIR